MQQTTYYLDLDAAERDRVQQVLHNVINLAERCDLWRRLALISYGLFMASAVLNLIQFFGR
jgi:hypothetical protein